MPVHGEWRHLRANADLALATGVPRDRVVIAEDGVVVDLVDGSRQDRRPGRAAGYVYVDGPSVGEVTESSLKDRRILGDEGFISVFVVVDSATGKIMAGPEIHARGSASRTRRSTTSCPGSRRSWPARRERRIGDAPAPAAGPAHGRQVGHDTYRRRPMIIPVVVEV